jgi:hypothetical protein
MAQLYSGILDHIARFFILLSDVPEGGGADNNDNSTPLVNNEHNNTQNDGGDQQRRWAVDFDGGICVRRQGGSGENGVWQRRRQVIRAGTQQSINDPLQWTMTRQRGQQEGECNNQIEVDGVSGQLMT